EFFSEPAAFSYAGFFAEDDSEALAGQKIGNYRIIREIGRGGMGAIYLAERADGKFEQQVAVKMLKRELNTGVLRRNFRREKEILAALSHPNIAKLLDAGTTAGSNGIPYIVMEYVEGIPIDEFCRDRKLSLNECLKLFNRVCEAAAFAHRNLIVHRDLKPSNILVTKDGVPKLLDFGISKPLDAPTGDHTITNLGAMTLLYASPEQIRGKTVTTAADIYSLGVILYKILTRNYPFDVKDKSDGNIAREITESEPQLPSLTTSASAGRGEENIIPAQLKGDLDNIILKALRKEPERRYKSVEQFSEDIWRFIDGMPVTARPNTFSYRAKKFYARNRISVVAGILILFSLIAGIGVAASQAIAARNQARAALESRQQAEVETLRAKSEEEKANKISRFMAKIISYANPAWYAEGSKYGGNARVIDAVEDLSGKIDAEFAGEADVQAELHHKFTEVFNMVKYTETDPARKEYLLQKQKFHALRALELRKQFYGERHELVAKDLFYAYGFIGKNDRERADLLAQAIEMMRETNPRNLNLPYMLEAYSSRLISPDNSERHDPYLRAAIPSTDQNNYQLGERYLREALELFRSHYKEDNRAIFGNECNLVYALAMQKKWTEFERHFSICMQQKDIAPDSNWKAYIETLKKFHNEKHRTAFPN
ncbi:MAG: serine/threonine protein kinase, partial [Pyrinomonadaceae bacterium]